MTDPNTEPILSPGNAISSQNLRKPRASALRQSSSGTTGTSNVVQGSDETVGDMIAARLTSLVEDCIQQVISAKQIVEPFIIEMEGSSDEITERFHQSRKQALLRKDELEAERRKVRQAACQVIKVLNDTMEAMYSELVRLEGNSEDEITERLHQSRKQALLRKDKLEAERRKVRQGACQVIKVLNDTTEAMHSELARLEMVNSTIIDNLGTSPSPVPMPGLYDS